MKRPKAIVILKLEDGQFQSFDHPNFLRGFRASEVWFFGSSDFSKDGIEKELYISATMIASACNASFHQIS